MFGLLLAAKWLAAIRMEKEKGPPRSGHLNPETIVSWLKTLVRSGASAAALLERTPDFVEATFGHPGTASNLEQAIALEAAILEAIDSLGGNMASAMKIYLGLQPGYRRTLVGFRQEAAGHVLKGMSGDSFRQKRHRDRYLEDLSVEIYKALKE